MGNAESTTAESTVYMPKKPESPFASTSPPSVNSSGVDQADSFIFADMLMNVLNERGLSLSHVRRVALLESIAQVSQLTELDQKQKHQMLTEIVTEAILTSPTLDQEEKDLIVREGLLEQRWDRVLVSMGLNGVGNGQFCRVIYRNDENPFVNYRKLALTLLRTSQKLQHIPSDSWKRLKSMMFQTKNKAELDDLMFRALERMCGSEVKARIMEDFVTYRYHRLSWQDRLDCIEEYSSVPGDQKPAAIEYNNKFGSLPIYKKILLPGECESIDMCPICLDPVLAPVVQLACDHIFCGRCISDWTIQQTGSHREKESFCPVCRHPMTAD